MRSLAPAETLTQPPAQAPLRTSHSQFLRYIFQRDQQGLRFAKFVELAICLWGYTWQDARIAETVGYLRE